MKEDKKTRESDDEMTNLGWAHLHIRCRDERTVGQRWADEMKNLRRAHEYIGCWVKGWDEKTELTSWGRDER